MRLISIFLFCLFALPLQADQIDPPLPALYAVTNVDADDWLNVRAQPNGNAALVSSFPPDATGIEVVALSREGQWAQVNLAETSGWVALRYLRPEPLTLNLLGLPVGLQCSGTEPFWTMEFSDERSLSLKTPEGQTQHSILSLSPTAGFVDLSQSGLRFSWQTTSTTATAHILPGTCTDGMSDRAYGLHYIDDQGPRRGCCSLN